MNIRSMSSLKCPLFLSDFNRTQIFSTYFRNNNEISNFMKIPPLGAELLHADGQTRRDRQPLFTMLRKTPKLRLAYNFILRPFFFYLTSI
jgi:hypothetical protein